MSPINRISLLLVLIFALLVVEIPTNASARPCLTGTVEINKLTVRQGESVTVTFSITNCDVRIVRNADANLFIYSACPDPDGGDYMEYGNSVVNVRRKVKLDIGATESEEVTFAAPAPIPCGNYVACLWLTTPHDMLAKEYAYFTVTQ